MSLKHNIMYTVQCTCRFTLVMRRKPLYYVMNIMLPCLMLSLLDLLVFCLPPESGEKVSLGITVLLSFSVFLLVIADNVPQTSETAPLLGKSLTRDSCLSLLIMYLKHLRQRGKIVKKRHRFTWGWSQYCMNFFYLHNKKIAALTPSRPLSLQTYFYPWPLWPSQPVNFPFE